MSSRFGVRAGSINPNLFQDQEYKFGSLCNPIRGNPRAAQCATFSTPSKSPGTSTRATFLSGSPTAPTILARKASASASAGLKRRLRTTHSHLAPDQRLLVEYKPFEPAFYHTDIADWGMASQLARDAGPQARVLVDTGHHYASQNIEQIVAWLLHTGLLGGFHFNDRRYADDDLTLGSIDPYQVFASSTSFTASHPKSHSTRVAFMIDQSHNLKGKIEANVQTVMTAQELWLKAALRRPRTARRPPAILRPCRGRGTLPGRILARRSAAAPCLARSPQPSDGPLGRSA